MVLLGFVMILAAPLLVFAGGQPEPEEAMEAEEERAEPAGALGAGLVGELEGPEILSDPGQFPSSFSEAPMLSERVSAGDLPAVEDRLPVREDLLVVEPVHEIGKYGGTWNRAFTGARDGGNAIRVGMALDRILMTKWDRSTWVPNLAKDLEIRNGGREFVVHLRRGLKWSNGDPLTSEDFAFWWNDIYKHEDFGMGVNSALLFKGEEAEFEVVDDYTFLYRFPEPNYLFADRLSGWYSINSHATWSNYGLGGGFAPSEYLKQFHGDYRDIDELRAEASEAGFTDWMEYFQNQKNHYVNIECPVATPWIMTRPINDDVMVWERNPYYYAVDTAGNQLPYIDQIVFELVPEANQLNLNAIAGKYDYQSRHLQVANIPVFIENQEQGDYKLYLDRAGYGTEVGIGFNMTYGLMPRELPPTYEEEIYEDFDPEIAELIRTKDFRHAVSLAIDREQINEARFLGLAIPGSGIPGPNNPYYPGDEWKTKWHELDVERANELLDELGYTERDPAGLRLRKDGNGPLALEIIGTSGRFGDPGPILEMLVDQLQAIGVQVIPRVVDQNLAETLNGSNAVQAQLHENSNTERVFGGTFNLFPRESGSWMGPLWGMWFANPDWGVRPSDPMVELMEIWRAGPTMTEEERNEAGKKIWELYVEETWMAGIVGRSFSVMGVRVAKNNMGNVPGRLLPGTDTIHPSAALPPTFYFKD